MAFFRPAPLRLASFGLVAGLVAFAGCDSSGSAVVPVTHPTMIRVEPEDFLGQVPCNPNGPGLKRYVATIVDRNYGEGGAPGSNDLGAGGAEIPQGGAEGFQSPSSLPTPCTTGTGFGFVVPGRHYEVFIDGYDTDAIAPRATGSSEMVPVSVDPEATLDDVHTAVLEPRWRTKCTRAIAVDSTVVRADRCAPFELDSDTSTGTLRLGLGSLLGSLQCGTEVGDVDHLEITGGPGDLMQTAACSADAQALFTAAPGTKLSFEVAAVGRGNANDDLPIVLAGAQCNGVVKAGVSVDASCSALSRVTTLQLDLNAALLQLGGTCGTAEVSSVTVTPIANGDKPRTFSADCRQPLTFGFVAEVPPQVKVEATFAAEPTSRQLVCHGNSRPGQQVAAVCEPM